MARKRMIDMGILTSEQVARLNRYQRWLYVGTILIADDEGRLKGSPAFLKASILPYDNVPLKVVETDIERIAEVGLIVRWRETVTGEWYIQHPNWSKYQSIRKDIFHASQIPAPPVRNEPVTHPLRTCNEPVTHPLRTCNEPVTHPLRTCNAPVTLEQQQISPEQKKLDKVNTDKINTVKISPVLGVEPFNSLSLLVAEGLSGSVAKYYADHLPIDYIREVITYCGRNSKGNIPGMIRSALQENWIIPKA